MKMAAAAIFLAALAFLAAGCGKKETKTVTAAVDYDLTVMDRDLVPAFMYQMYENPEEYEGKTVRMNGLYYVGYQKERGEYQPHTYAADTMGCSGQSWEFIWGEGSRRYPDEYPAVNERITVQGIFEAYRRDGSRDTEGRLRDAVLEIRRETEESAGKPLVK